MKRKLRSLSLVFFHFVTLGTSQTLIIADFPDCAQKCFDIIDPTCIKSDPCICSAIGYLATIANCIGIGCGDSTTVLGETADTLLSDCDLSGVGLGMSKPAFVSAGQSAATAYPTGTNSTIPQPTQTAKSKQPSSTSYYGNRLSNSDKIALGLGIGIGLPTGLATIWMCIRMGR